MAQATKQLTEQTPSPLENFEINSSALVSKETMEHSDEMRTIIPIIETIASIREILSTIKIADLKSIVENPKDNPSLKIGEIINQAEISEEVKEKIRQLVIAFFIRITAALSTTPRRGRPVGSKNTPKKLGTSHKKPARKSADKAPAKLEIPEEAIEQYKTALELTLENYNKGKKKPDQVNPTEITSAKQIPAELKTMLRYIPFMIIARAKDKDKIQIAAVKALMDSPEGRKAAATALRRIFTNKDFSEISSGSMFAWVAPKFREESKDENPTRWESAIGELKDVEFPDHEGTIGEMLTDEPIKD